MDIKNTFILIGAVGGAIYLASWLWSKVPKQTTTA